MSTRFTLLEVDGRHCPPPYRIAFAENRYGSMRWWRTDGVTTSPLVVNFSVTSSPRHKRRVKKLSFFHFSSCYCIVSRDIGRTFRSATASIWHDMDGHDRFSEDWNWDYPKFLILSYPFTSRRGNVIPSSRNGGTGQIFFFTFFH